MLCEHLKTEQKVTKLSNKPTRTGKRDNSDMRLVQNFPAAKNGEQLIKGRVFVFFITMTLAMT